MTVKSKAVRNENVSGDYKKSTNKKHSKKEVDYKFNPSGSRMLF